MAKNSTKLEELHINEIALGRDSVSIAPILSIELVPGMSIACCSCTLLNYVT